jgi:predicted molibdopterin-dependent oxidoreductase YjgC
MSKRVNVIVDGVPVSTGEGVTVATMLMNAGTEVFRISITGERRGPVCGMGVCQECRVAIDGVAHQRACMRVVVDGMRIETGRDRARV